MHKTSCMLWLCCSVAATLVVGVFVFAGQEKKEALTGDAAYKIVHDADLKWSPALPGVEVAVRSMIILCRTAWEA